MLGEVTCFKAAFMKHTLLTALLLTASPCINATTWALAILIISELH